VNYIKRQKEHHQGESFEDEYKRVLREFGIEPDDRYVF
jgi:hypothetical protein